MKAVKKILFPTDFSPCARFAAGNALSLAKKLNADLYILHASLMFESDPNNPDKQLETGELKNEIMTDPEPYVSRRIDDLLKTYDVEARTHKVQVRGFTEVSAIMEWAKENEPDLIVMGTHGRRGFKRWLLGSVAEEIIRAATCPVITIKEHWVGDMSQVNTILAPLDFSEASRPAVRQALAMAKIFSARVHLLHVIQEPFLQDVYGSAYPGANEYRAETETRARAIMNAMLDEENAKVEANVVVTTGHPAKEIVRYADESNADLVLMAHKGHSSLPDRILGSVTEHVSRAAHAPVYTTDLH